MTQSSQPRQTDTSSYRMVMLARYLSQNRESLAADLDWMRAVSVAESDLTRAGYSARFSRYHAELHATGLHVARNGIDITRALT